MKRTLSIWKPVDWIVGLIAGAISMALYAYTVSPSVGLLDAGEFMVAAENFGVPHPTGYPLWTILTWLFQLLPLGNAAWEINLFSSVCGALAVAVTGTLLCNILRWYFDGEDTGRFKWLPPIISLAFALLLAVSESMWSQATITEVYTLHALLVAIIFTLCYMWVRQPYRDSLMLLVFFTMALAFSNHHLVLALAVGLVPYLLILLLRRRMFLDWLFAGLLTVALVFLGFANISVSGADDLANRPVVQTALRFTMTLALAFGIFVWMRRFRVRWRFIAFLPFAVILGLLPYAYMPFASSTNPPMNWGYARETSGFFFSINRSQYSGSLSDLSVKSVGRLMGTYMPSDEPKASPSPQFPEPSIFTLAQRWIGFFWLQLTYAFTPIAFLGYFGSMLFVLRLPLEKRAWIYQLHIAFVMAAFLQPISMKAETDKAGWWLVMPYHTYTNLIFALIAGLGVGLVIRWLCQRRQVYFWIAPALLLLPLFTARHSEGSSSQRDRLFGWDYGYDMLKDLPKGSIMIGGTDPGRFVPTYMILGESLQPAKDRRDPNFDRRDLYIITQNALGEPNYMKYLRDQYTKSRPKPANAFERWLGRENTYPEKPILLPTSDEVREALKKTADEKGKTPEELFESRSSILFSTVLKWIWEKNRDEHDFYIEESFPIEWTYDYATPHGLIYKLNKTKVELTKEDVARDFAFWKEYKNKLLSDPNFRKDFDAQRSFSKLRNTMGNIYSHRKMFKEAEAAYREALELWPENPEPLYRLTTLLWDQGRYDDPIRLQEIALATDPNNDQLWRLRAMSEVAKKTDAEIQKLTAKLTEQPKSAETLRQLIRLHDQIYNTNKVQPLVERAMRDFADDPDMMRFLIDHYEAVGELEKSDLPAKRLIELENSNLAGHFALVRAYFRQTNKADFYKAAEKAIEVGGQAARNGLLNAPQFAPWQNDPEFKNLGNPGPLAPAVQPPPQ